MLTAGASVCATNWGERMAGLPLQPTVNGRDFHSNVVTAAISGTCRVHRRPNESLKHSVQGRKVDDDLDWQVAGIGHDPHGIDARIHGHVETRLGGGNNPCADARQLTATAANQRILCMRVLLAGGPLRPACSIAKAG
jgi:hypothetical protein